MRRTQPDLFFRALAICTAVILTSTNVHGQQQGGPPESVGFYSARDSHPNKIDLMNPDVSNLRRLTYNRASDADPDISPDGQELTFTSHQAGNNEIFIRDRWGAIKNLTNNSGRQIVFGSDRDGDPTSLQTAPKLPTALLKILDFSHADHSVLVSAEQTAAAIFKEGGIDTAWFECRLPQECSFLSGRPQFLLVIRRNSGGLLSNTSEEERLIQDHTLGFSIPCSTMDTCLCYILYSPIYSFAEQYRNSPGQVLGQVIAHEIGHALLGPNAHTAMGIMRPRLQLADKKTLLYFTPEQAKRLRSELSARMNAASGSNQHVESNVFLEGAH